MNAALSDGERRGFVTHCLRLTGSLTQQQCSGSEASGLLGFVCGKKEEFVKLDFLKSLWA